MDADNPGLKLEFQNHVPFGFEMPSDNEVSTMVDQYLSKDTLNAEDDWARVVDEAICIMSNPDYVSMPATMNSSNNSEVNYNGMFSDQSSHASLSSSHPNFENFYQNQVQYVDHGTVFLDQNYISQDHFSHQQNLPQNGAYSSENNSNYYHGQHQSNQRDYAQNSPIYYVSHTVNKIPACSESHPDHAAVTYQNYASLPGLNTMSVMNFHQTVRTQSSSSGGTSPSSQSPVSEEEYHEPAPFFQRALQKRSKETALQKKAKGVKPRRRKKDPNEPTKPVSAYALFFRDTQATIKGTKPDASFGEVSKIVAAMWDTLDAERKTMYKKRTEEAKKDYLQQLALYRASLITSPPETSLYVHSNYQSRSPPMPSYNRPNIYSTGNHGQHTVKTQNVSPPAMASPSHITQDDCSQMKNEGQIYARIVEPEIMSPNDYLPWETPDMERETVLTHCKDSHMYSNWMINHQPSSPSVDNIVI